MKVTLKPLLIVGLALIGAAFAGHKIAKAAGGSDYEMEHVHWHFNGWTGTYDRAAMQRGYQVYREVCSSCHQLEFMAFRHLGDVGAPFYHKDYPNPIDNPWVKALAADWTIDDIDWDDGSDLTRSGKPADKFPSPYANIIVAQASNFGKAPPNLSVMVKARPGGADHLYNFLMSYDKDDDRYNHLLASQVAMPDQLFDGRVEYEDGTEATKAQMAKDVTEFLAWAADPKMEARKSTGMIVMIFLLILSILMFLSFRTVWRDVKH